MGATTQVGGEPPAIAPAAASPAIAPRVIERPLRTLERTRPNPREGFTVVVLLPALRADFPGNAVDLVDEGDDTSASDATFDMRKLGERIVLDVKQARSIAHQNDDAKRALRQFVDAHPRARAVALEVCATVTPLDVQFVAGLGELRAIEYEVPKSSARAGLPFRHRFRRGKQVLAMTPSGAHVVLRRKGSLLRVTSRGIED